MTEKKIKMSEYPCLDCGLEYEEYPTVINLCPTCNERNEGAFWGGTFVDNTKTED